MSARRYGIIHYRIPAPVRYMIKGLTLLPILLCHQLFKLLPHDSKRVCIGAWFGKLYADNPKYFAEYLLENSDFVITWIGESSICDYLPKHPRLHFAPKGSWTATRELFRAKFWISSIAYANDLTNLPIDGGAICINLWHGIPIKQNGRQSAMNSGDRLGVIRNLLSKIEDIYAKIISGEKEWLLVASKSMAKLLLIGGPNNFASNKILRFGSPRNDFLINNKQNDVLKSQLKEKYARLLGFDNKKRIVLHLPTWRAIGNDIFCFYNLPKEIQIRIKTLLDNHSAILIEKHHLHTYELFPRCEKSICSISVETSALPLIDIQELILCSDILIGDYSSTYVDFGLLGRPYISYAYDLDYYSKNDYGLAYKLTDVTAGPIVSTIDDLITVVNDSLDTGYVNPADGFRKLVQYKSGNARGQLLNFMLQHAN